MTWITECQQDSLSFKNSLHNDKLIWKQKCTGCFVIVAISGRYSGIATAQPYKRHRNGVFVERVSAGDEKCPLILAAHWWALSELCQGLNNGAGSVAFSECVGSTQCFRSEVCVHLSVLFCLFVFCFCRSLEWSLFLISSEDLSKLVKYQIRIFTTIII